MTKVKRAITIDEDLDREAQRFAGPNFSAFVIEALRRQVRVAKLNRLVEADRQERGSVDADVDRVSDEVRDLDR